MKNLNAYETQAVSGGCVFVPDDLFDSKSPWPFGILV